MRDQRSTEDFQRANRVEDRRRYRPSSIVSPPTHQRRSGSRRVSGVHQQPTCRVRPHHRCIRPRRTTSIQVTPRMMVEPRIRCGAGLDRTPARPKTPIEIQMMPTASIAIAANSGGPSPRRSKRRTGRGADRHSPAPFRLGTLRSADHPSQTNAAPSRTRSAEPPIIGLAEGPDSFDLHHRRAGSPRRDSGHLPRYSTSWPRQSGISCLHRGSQASWTGSSRATVPG